MRPKVYFTDLRTRDYGDGPAEKLKTLLRSSDFMELDMEGKFVAVKMHFGEHGNAAHIRPQYVKAVTDLIKEKGGKPFLTDCATMYPGSRKNAIDHLYCAWENGFSPLSTGCPIIIGDGLKGTDEVIVPVPEGEYVKSAKIGRTIMDADVFISLNHFKGHNFASLGGALKNIGMGCGSRSGKKEQHSSGQAQVNPDKCRGCGKCLANCANEGLVFDKLTKKMTVDLTHCVGCGNCLGVCNFDAIEFINDEANELLSRRIAEYAWAVVHDRPQYHINLLMDISPGCDCHGENDVPILPNIGMLACADPLAIDQASVDLCLKEKPLPGSKLWDEIHSDHFKDHGDHFVNLHPESDWKSCFEQAEKLKIGSRSYEKIDIFTAK